MSILVVGSVAYDSVVTPAGSRDDALGGSATFFSVSASYFTKVRVVAIVGSDFKDEHVQLLMDHGVDVTGIERAEGKTFRWSGVYSTEDVDARRTLETSLNVFADFAPKLRPEDRGAEFLFLANIDPDLQLDVLGQMDSRPKLVALDTMNFWIERKNSSLRRVLADVDMVFIDEGEAREFASEFNLVKCARQISELGPSIVVIKRGEHGAMLFHSGSVFAVTAFPLENAVDPTGAGDSFAGGVMGYLASTGDLSPGGLRRAIAAGSVMGSFAVESFSVDRVASLEPPEIDDRFRAFTELSRFEPLEKGASVASRSTA